MKAVSDVISPLSGEILEVNEKAVDEPEIVNEDPYGEGWLSGSGCPTRRSSTRCSTRTRTAHTWRSSSPARGLRQPDRRRPERDARGDRRLLDRRSLRADPSRTSASSARSTSSRRCPRPSSRGSSRSSRPRTPTRASSCRSSAWASTTTTSRRSSTRLAARRVPDRVHAVPARDEPGRPAGDLRVPDRDLRAHRDGRLERVRLRRLHRRGRRLLHREARDRPLEGCRRRDASTRWCARS